MEYDKPHLTIPEQVEKLRARGLAIADEDEAGQLLANVGYYRLSAYAYPFRKSLGAGAIKTSSVQYRESDFEAGTTLEAVKELWAFDRKLRLLCLDALETVEIAMRSRVGFHRGARNKFGYLAVDDLESTAVARRPLGVCECDTPTHFEAWVCKYKDHQNSAEAEDFITHYVEKYDGKLPVWVATETMDFGTLVRLYGFMRNDDQSAIARDLASMSGAWLNSWIKVANYLRNVSAHHGRLWNRSLTYKLKTVPKELSPLAHLNESAVRKAKVYGILSVLAATTNHLDPRSEWRNSLIAHLDTFPMLEEVSPERNMGFPYGWKEQEVWMPR